jgi:hypothetical protein
MDPAGRRVVRLVAALGAAVGERDSLMTRCPSKFSSRAPS